MENYLKLSKLYYKKINIEEELKKRLENPCVYKTSLYIFPVLKRRKNKGRKGAIFFAYKRNIGTAR